MHFAVTIRRPADEVWSYLADPGHETDWQQGVLSSSHEPPGPIAVGTRRSKVRRTPFGNQRFTVEYTRVDSERREWEDVVVDGIVRGSTGHYRVIPESGGSRVLLDVVMRYSGLGRLLGPMIDRSSRADLGAGLERLRTVMEQQDSRTPGTAVDSGDDESSSS